MNKDVEFLSNYKQFGRILALIKAMREDAIADLEAADTARIQQISGKIIALDSILSHTSAEEVIRKTDSLP